MNELNFYINNRLSFLQPKDFDRKIERTYTNNVANSTIVNSKLSTYIVKNESNKSELMHIEELVAKKYELKNLIQKVNCLLFDY